MEYFDDVRLTMNDFLVTPEILGPDLHTIAPGVRTIVFNQGTYNTFRHYSLNPDDLQCAYHEAQVVGAIVISEDGRRYLSHAFPKLRVHRLHHSIDPAVFFPREKKRQISFMPRKHPEDAQQVINILKFRGALRGFGIVPIDNADEIEVARILGESLIFLSFGYPEGFGLPAAEAMASGCATIGYHGMGGREFLRQPYAYPIEAGDILGFAQTVERVLQAWDDDPASIRTVSADAVQFIRQTYSIERERQDIVTIWKSIFNG